MKISTKTGDRGQTGLFSGKRILKSAEVIEILGNLDELNCFVGWGKVEAGDIQKKEFLEKIQKDIYRIMSILGNEGKVLGDVKMIDEGDLGKLEEKIQEIERTGEVAGFVIPGENEFSARMHVVRTVCRKVERATIKYSEKNEIDPLVLKYLNRLSDLFFAFSIDKMAP